MAAPTRYTQKLFGTSNSTAGQFSQYGAFNAGSPGSVYSGTTITPAFVQALSNFGQGLFGALVGNNSPFRQDINSLFYLAFYQLYYLLERGLADYDSGTTYNINDYVQESGVLYRSTANSNSGNDPATGGMDWGSPIVQALELTNSAIANYEVVSGHTFFAANYTIGSSFTQTIDSGGFMLVGTSLTVSGILQVNGTLQMF